MISVEKAAKLSNGRCQMCSKCPLMPCSELAMKVCRESYIRGFKKGVQWNKMENI